MKYCLSGDQPKEYLLKADEIKIKPRNLNSILDLYELNPKATIILELPAEMGEIEVDWEKLKRYNIMLQGNFIVSTFSAKLMENCKKYGIKFYYPVPVGTFYELNALKDFGCCYALIDAPLTHSLDKVKMIDIPIRMVPNVAYYALIPRKNGVVGSWVRPEDVHFYENYVDVFEFEDCDLKKERGLYRVYNEQKAWPGDLNLLITNLNKNVEGFLISSTAFEPRLTCGQGCQQGKACKICHRITDLANKEVYSQIKPSNLKKFDKVD